MKKIEEPQFDKRSIEEIIALNGRKPGALLTILEEIQESNEFKFLDREAMEYLSDRIDIPLSRIYSVATFYSFFNLEPQGKYTIVVCRGTACHTKGSKNLLDQLFLLPKCKGAFESGESSFTTEDREITVKTVACFGQCALAPVVAVDGVIYNNVTTGQIKAIVKKIEEERDNENIKL
ncbi:MAG: NAD(P)H-dependent oxidoreductase subunit E [Bacteroidales bacterium]